MEMIKNELKELFESKDKNLTYKQIKRFMRSKFESEDILTQALEELQNEGYLYLNDYQEYTLLEKQDNFIIGELRVKNKKAYVVNGKYTVTIPDSHLNGAIAGDKVVVQCNNLTGNSRGEIKRILKRKGKILFDYINGELVPVDYPFKLDIFVSEKELKDLIDGSRVQIDITLDTIEDKYVGHVNVVVAHKDDPDMDIKTLLVNEGVILGFSAEAMKQALELPTSVSQKEIDERLSHINSRDYRSFRTMTIDPERAKDFDDAFSIFKKEDGGYIVYSYIADPTYYIKEGTPLDIEAYEKGTSTYPFAYVEPMLPHIISNGICSLNPNVDRMSFVCELEYDKHGNLLGGKLVDGIIRSDKRMMYGEVNDIFQNGNRAAHPDYEDFLYDLAVGLELSEKRTRIRNNNGKQSFGDNGSIYTESNGKCVAKRKDERGIAQIMIENIAVDTNEIMAEFAYYMGCELLFRVHPSPDPKSVLNVVKLVQETAKKYGKEFKIKIPNNLDNPYAVQSIINQIRAFDDGEVFQKIMVTAMKKAYYSPQNYGHFGLAMLTYIHFTSPIRRYPDLMNHRLLRLYRDHADELDYDAIHAKLAIAGPHLSQRERISEKAERVANRFKTIQLYEGRIGEEFEANITSVNNNSISIQLPDLTTGTIGSKELNKAGFILKNGRVYNKETGSELVTGFRILVKLIEADVNKDKIGFAYLDKLVIDFEELKEKQKTYKINSRDYLKRC